MRCEGLSIDDVLFAHMHFSNDLLILDSCTQTQQKAHTHRHKYTKEPKEVRRCCIVETLIECTAWASACSKTRRFRIETGMLAVREECGNASPNTAHAFQRGTREVKLGGSESGLDEYSCCFTISQKSVSNYAIE